MMESLAKILPVALCFLTNSAIFYIVGYRKGLKDMTSICKDEIKNFMDFLKKSIETRE